MKKPKTRVYEPKNLNPMARRMLKDRKVSVIVDNFHGVNWWEQSKRFPCFCVYDKPMDFPDKVVVRLFDGKTPTRLLCVKETLEEARKAIPPNFLQMPRSETDAGSIVETWL